MGNRGWSIGGLVVGGALLAIPLSSASCAHTACFLWSAEAGECPAQNEALARFSSPDCGGVVQSVDGQGSFDGQLCCYPVTQIGSSDFGVGDCNIIEEPPSGVGGATTGTSGVGGVGGSPCTSCANGILGSTLDPPSLCPAAQMLFDQLFFCACKGPCAAQCGDNVCSSQPGSQECGNCVTTPDPDGCADEFNACSNDL